MPFLVLSLYHFQGGSVAARLQQWKDAEGLQSDPLSGTMGGGAVSHPAREVVSPCHVCRNETLFIEPQPKNGTKVSTEHTPMDCLVLFCGWRTVFSVLNRIFLVLVLFSRACCSDFTT